MSEGVPKIVSARGAYQPLQAATSTSAGHWHRIQVPAEMFSAEVDVQ